MAISQLLFMEITANVKESSKFAVKKTAIIEKRLRIAVYSMFSGIDQQQISRF